MRVKTKAGREIILHDDVLCALLDAGVVERIVESPKPMPPHQTHWHIEFSVSGEPVLRPSCTHGGSDVVMGRHIEKYRFKHCGLEEPVPPEVIARYNDGQAVDLDGAKFIG